MADNLVFKVKFDLQKGVDEALKDGDKALERIEKVLGKHPITIKLRMDNQVTRGASAELTGFKKQLAELTQQWNSLTAAERGSAAGAAIREKFRALRTEAQGYTSTLQAAVKAEDKMRESHSKTEASANKLSSAYHKQSTYLSRLIQRMAAYAGVSYVGNFLTNVREVAAQFELQRISLGAIIQDQQRANQLFSEIKQFALKSPVKILDLTKYTKQLAAYKVGWDGVKTDTKELFDWTKKLTDVSVGLGVSMDRVVLAFGQVRATGYLRASEIRQFTEMGVPIVEELAAKLSKMNGELVTAAQVMDMVSKRGISFEMVKDVFNDMTSAGGIFYNMQEKQGNTLFGMWQKLGDAAAVMYDEIGNTSYVNENMKGAIQILRALMLNWKQTGTVLGTLTAAIVLYTIQSKMAAFATRLQSAEHIKYIATLKAEAAQLAVQSRLTIGMSRLQRLEAAWALKGAQAKLSAATATNVFSKALYRLKAAFLTNPFGWAALAIASLITLMSSAETHAEKLTRKIEEIDRDYNKLSKKSKERFSELVETVKNTVDGSQKQKDALDELNRAYGDIFPQETLEIENIKKMGEGYGELTAKIDAYYEKRRGEEKSTAIKENYGSRINEAKETMTDYLRTYGATEDQISEFWEKVDNDMLNGIDGVVSMSKRLKEINLSLVKGTLTGLGHLVDITSFSNLTSAWGELGREVEAVLGRQNANLFEYGRLQDEMNDKLDKNEESTYAAVSGLGSLAGAVDTLNNSLSLLDWSSLDAFKNTMSDYNKKHPRNPISAIFDTTYDPSKARNALEKSIEEGNIRISAIFAQMKQTASKAGFEIPNEFFTQAKSVVDGNTDFSFINWDAIMKLTMSDEARTAMRQYRLFYENIAPSNKTVAAMRSRLMQIGAAVDSTGAIMDKLSKHLMKSGDDWENYSKSIYDAVKGYEAQIDEMRRINASIKSGAKGTGPLDPQKYSDEEIKKVELLVEALKQLFPFLAPQKTSGSSKSDPRLQNLKEEISLTKKLYDEYHKLEKQIGATKAAEKIQEIYSNTIKTLQDRAAKYGFEFELPFTDENLKSNMQHFIDKMKELQGLKDKKGKPLFPNIGKEIDEAVAQLEDVDLNSLQKALEKKLKELSDRISRTKTAKEFYEKILSQTGNRNMAARLATSIFGENGEELNREIAERMRKMVEATSATLPDFVFNTDMSVNAKALRGWVEANKAALGDVAKELTKFADDAEKDTAKMVEGWLKATDKAKTYGDKLADVYRTTAAEISRIEAEMAKGNLGREEGTELIARYRRKEAEDIAKLQYEAFKDSPMYVQMFDDLDHASTRMLENMKSRLESMQGAWRNLDPTQLKEMQSRLREIDEQLAKRNPFKALADGIREYQKLRTKGDARGNKNRKNADEDAAEWAEKNRKAQEELAKIMSDPTATEARIAGAKQMVDYTKQQKDEALKAAENWKKVEDAIGMSLNNLFSMMGWAGDLARGIADISEAMGADEEDVQYWNDVADALDNISGGIQDIVSAAMSGNVVGVVSSVLTAVPKMIVGFAGLFSAGKIKRANKEIKRQQKILEQLEYTYGRLQYAADKLFGRDYVNNYNQQLENLQAQQTAYLKQAEAERSKGKKADKDKIKEYENQARETADKIKELQDDLAAHFTGSSRTDVARQMAQSWIDARASMSDTFAAIKGDYADMIKNMIVEGAAARVIENALTPMWNRMDAMLKDNNIDGAIDTLINGMDSALNAANNGMEVLWRAMEARGYDMKKLIGDTDSGYTGIAKNIAGATSEEINTAAAIGNTLMYYVSPIPRIDENLARVVAIMEGRGASAIPQTTSTGWTDWQQQAMDNYQAIARNTAETVVRCERAAIACEKMARAVKTKGATSGFNVFLNK